jgi:hypothetical protein
MDFCQIADGNRHGFHLRCPADNSSLLKASLNVQTSTSDYIRRTIGKVMERAIFYSEDDSRLATDASVRVMTAMSALWHVVLMMDKAKFVELSQLE